MEDCKKNNIAWIVGCLVVWLAVKQSVDGGLVGYGNEMMVKFSGYDGAVRG